jgi:hypothetical protein
VAAKDFDYTSRYLAGENWTILKYKDQDSWNAIFKGNMGYTHDGVEYEFGHGCAFEDTFGFYLWPEPSTATHLLVHRWTGGNVGAYLDVVDLQREFRHVLDDTNFSFSCIQDLNQDGAPELVGSSRAFDSIPFVIHISHAATPYPPLILSPGNGGRFQCVNHLYQDYFADENKKLEEAYGSTNGQNPIPADIIQSQKTDKFLALFEWAVHTYYTKGERVAEAIMDANLDPVLSAITKHAIYWQIRDDRLFPKELTKHFQDHPEDYVPIQRQPNE